MLLQTFNKDEKLAFAELAKIVIAADGIFHDKEMEIYHDICIEMDIKEDDVHQVENKNIEELIYIFSTRNSQIFAILELLSIAYVDDYYAIEEKSLIGKLSNLIGIKKDQLLKMQEWGKNRIQLGQNLLDIINM